MNLEIRRKLIHIMLGFFLAIAIYGDLITPFILGIIILIFLVLMIISKRKRVFVISWFLETFDRKCDLDNLPGKGPLFYLIGVFIVYAIFPKDIVLASIMALALGDAVSHIIGVKYGRTKNPFSDRKFLEGALAGILVATLGAWIFVSWHEAFFASLIAMVAEGIDIKIKMQKVDDNVVVPVVAAMVIWAMRFVGGG